MYRRVPRTKRNKEDLTLEEWYRAAGLELTDANEDKSGEGWRIHDQSSAYKAWCAGEDPTEWRAEASNGEQL